LEEWSWRQVEGVGGELRCWRRVEGVE